LEGNDDGADSDRVDENSSLISTSRIIGEVAVDDEVSDDGDDGGVVNDDDDVSSWSSLKIDEDGDGDDACNSNWGCDGRGSDFTDIRA
jgi:hypothetical protein